VRSFVDAKSTATLRRVARRIELRLKIRDPQLAAVVGGAIARPHQTLAVG
jgi:hypothetical protein